MTEIPEHLLKRAKAARSKSSIESDDDSRTPAHLRRRSGEPGNGNNDPFEAKKQSAQDIAASLVVAKNTLLVAVRPLRTAVEDADVSLVGQFFDTDKLKFGASFTPPTGRSKAAAFVTLYSDRELFTEVEGGKSLRVGEQTAWRMPIDRREIPTVLKEAGQNPFRDTWNLARDGYVFTEAGEISARLATRVFETNVAERATTSVTLFEGEPNRQAFNRSYQNRYAASLSVTRNPANTPESEAVFGVDLLSLDGSYRVDQGRADDGSKQEGERVVYGAASSYLNRIPSDEAFMNVCTSASVVFTAFGELLGDPSAQNALLACQSIDKNFQ